MSIASVGYAGTSKDRFLDLTDDVRFLRIALPVVFAYVAAALAYRTILGVPESQGFIDSGQKFFVIFESIRLILIVLTCSAAVSLLFRSKFWMPGRSVENEVRRVLPRVPAIPVMFAIGILSFASFIYAYAIFKTRIPEVRPFDLDPLFAAMDAAMFGGRQAWEYFRWVYDMPGLVAFLDHTYNIWVWLMQCSFVYCFVARSESLERRVRYFLAFVFAQIIGGTVLATLLSSVGPVFYGFVVAGADPYAEQMALLQAHAPLHATNYQAILWQDYSMPGVGQLGISAMPSMHCAITTLFLLMFNRSAVMRVAGWAFAILIFFGSFLLAWHYVVDGMLGVALAWACWIVAGRISRRLTADAPVLKEKTAV